MQQTNPAVQQKKNGKWSDRPLNQSGRRAKGLRWKGYVIREPSLSSEWKRLNG